DYTAEITTSPLSFADRNIVLGDRKSFRRAIAFVVPCLPLGMLLQRFGFSFLGLEGTREYVHWINVIVGVLLFVSITILVMSIFHRARFRDALHVGLFPLGALWIMSPAIFLGASATVWLLHKVAYIPDFHLDKTQFDNFEAIWTSEFLRCLDRVSAVFAALDI